MTQMPTAGYRGDVSVVPGLLDRGDLLERLDRAGSKRVTVISAPAGSGKTSLLRAWADSAPDRRRVALVSVERDEHDAERFWSAVLRAIGGTADARDPGEAAALDGDHLVDRVVSAAAEQVEPLVLIVDDLHELRSA